VDFGRARESRTLILDLETKGAICLSGQYRKVVYETTVVALDLNIPLGANSPFAGHWCDLGWHGTLTHGVIRSCRIPIQDMGGVSHTVESMAATRYEALRKVRA
jgi:hypothetical protein